MTNLLEFLMDSVMEKSNVGPVIYSLIIKVCFSCTLFMLPLYHLATRRRAAGGKGHGYESTRRGSKESKAMPAPDANAELQASMQVNSYCTSLKLPTVIYLVEN